MTLELPSDLADFVQSMVNSGKYVSAGDVVCAGLQALQLRNQEMLELGGKIDEGLDDLERGDFIEIFDEAAQKSFFEQLRIGVLNSAQATENR